MKTKHLFFAAALAASFTACTNDDIIEVQQQGVATVERPTVENVQLNFIGEGAESRLTYNGQYAWEATDTIGALLMDQPTGKGKMWHEQYTLSQWVNTSYPFTYSTEDGTWSCPGKMLEGNYFFAYPFSSYDGGRSMTHSLLNQSQKGIKSDVVAKALAANQIFIGYSQIKKGSAFDVLEDVEMTSVLGALQLRIKNTSDKTYHVNKFVVRGENDIISELTFNPTAAAYKGTLPEDEEGTLPDNTEKFSYKKDAEYWFNYANYVGDEENKTLYQIDEETNAKYYNRAEALRKVVNAGAESREVIYLNVEGTEAERAWAKGQTAYALIMVNPLATFEGTISVEVYTDEGAFEAVANLAQAETLNNEPITKLLPGVSATVVDECDFETVVDTDEFPIYTEEDMLQFIAWNKTLNTTLPVTATLHTDITLTKAMFDDMKSAAKVTWNFVGAAQAVAAADEAEEGEEEEVVEPTVYKLILAEDLPANVLNYKKLSINDNLDVVVEGTINFTQTVSVDELTIEEGAVMNINVAVNNKTAADTDVKLPKIINKGTLNIAGVQVLGAGNIVNAEEGTINVAANSDVKGAADLTDDNDAATDENMALVNSGIINSAAYMQYVKNNAGGVINLTGAAVLKNLTNAAEDKANKLAEGTVNAAAGTSVSGTNAGLIACADNTVTISSNIGGKVALEVTGNVAKEAYKNLNYNTLKIKGVTTFADIQTGISHIITTEGSELKLAAATAAYKLELTSLEINGATTITTVLSGTTANKVRVASMNVKKGATLTNNGVLEVSTTWENEGLVINNQSAALPDATAVASPGSWKYNLPTLFVADKTSADAVLEVGSKTIKAAKTEWEAKNPSNNINVKGLKITGTLDMSDADNSAYTDYFTDVELAGDGKIVNLKNSHAISMTKLVVNNDAVIDGTAKMIIAKTAALELNGSLSIANGYLEISNASAVAGMSSEKIYGLGAVNGSICAAVTDGYLWWDADTKLWKKDLTDNSQAVTVSDLSTFSSNINVKPYIILGSNVELSENLSLNKNTILNLNGKTLKGSINSGNIDLVVKNGKVDGDDGQAIKSPAGKLTLENVEVTGKGYVIEVNGGVAEIKGGKVTSKANHAKYAIGVENCELTIDGVDFTGNAAGGVSATFSELNLKGSNTKKLNLVSGNDSQYGLHIAQTKLTYNNNVEFASCYLQTIVETSMTNLGSSYVNGTEFKGGEKNETCGTGYLWLENAKESLEKVIESKVGSESE